MLLPKNIKLISLADINCTEEIEETAQTLKENSLLKAKYIYENYQLNCFADDSGLEVEALNGAPGIYSARYAGSQKNEADNNQKLLAELKNKTNRKACFKTIITLITCRQTELVEGKTEPNIYFFEGIIEGEIVHEKQGTQGFCYDPLFKPLGFDKTFAQMSPQEKNRISHRALAVNKLVDFLKQNTP